MRYKWGIDLGGTKIEAVILDAENDNKIIARERVPTHADQGYEMVLSQMGKLVKQISDNSGLTPTHIGIGTPGRVDPVSQTMKNSNSICLNGQALHKDLESLLGVDLKVENDANCFALSEARHLLATDFPNAQVIFGVIMGTGVGGGIVAHGKIISGLHGIGGEWGHNFLDESGGPCYCGKSGCVEKVLAGPALEKYYHGISGKKLSMPEIVKNHEAGQDEFATKTIDRLYEFFGKGISQIINVLDPEVIVIGGGVGNVDGLYTEGFERVKNYLFNNRLRTSIVKPKFGDSSGVIGAALL